MHISAEIIDILFLSLRVSILASLIGLAIGAPMGAYISTLNGKVQTVWLTVFSALLAVPTVVVGLVVYLLLSRSGPLGWLNILFTPTAIVIAQVLITVPVITVFVHRACTAAWNEVGDALRLDIARRWRRMWEIGKIAKAGLVTAFLVAFGRAISEVGAVMIVGGNIRGETRVMTTAITLETRQGNFSIAVWLGIILVLLSFSVTVITFLVTRERNKSKI
ncbi:ABC transporter permease [Ahrensia marina]|uniref:ABC transporter permease n=1 Tax=Ahrensia marina TaxID=1514904 RepID=A0A0N1J6L6_9HYPH|nr:ABC transporter permease [Ahrensia marina]KPB02824.1 ABC transporter permease [Ahrensia marina]